MLILSPAAGLREVVPQVLESVKDSLICSIGSVHSVCFKLTGKVRSLGMQTEGKRCIEATSVIKITLGIDHPAHETFN